MNEQVHFNARGTCARYMGVIEISPKCVLYTGSHTTPFAW